MENATKTKINASLYTHKVTYSKSCPLTVAKNRNKLFFD